MKKEDFIKAVEYFEFQYPYFEEGFDLKGSVEDWLKKMNTEFSRYNEALRSFFLKEGNENYPYIKKDMVVSFIKVKDVRFNFKDYKGIFNYYNPLIFFRVDEQIRYPKKKPIHYSYTIGNPKPSDRWDYITTEEEFFKL